MFFSVSSELFRGLRHSERSLDVGEIGAQALDLAVHKLTRTSRERARVGVGNHEVAILLSRELSNSMSSQCVDRGNHSNVIHVGHREIGELDAHRLRDVVSESQREFGALFDGLKQKLSVGLLVDFELNDDFRELETQQLKRVCERHDLRTHKEWKSESSSRTRDTRDQTREPQQAIPVTRGCSSEVRVGANATNECEQLRRKYGSQAARLRCD